MYISNLSHFLDETGSMPKQMPAEGRQMAGFLIMVVDTATKNSGQQTETLRCFSKKCNGIITSFKTPDNKEIVWKCSGCSNEGVVNGWQGTKWDNR